MAANEEAQWVQVERTKKTQQKESKGDPIQVQPQQKQKQQQPNKTSSSYSNVTSRHIAPKRPPISQPKEIITTTATPREALAALRKTLLEIFPSMDDEDVLELILDFKKNFIGNNSSLSRSPDEWVWEIAEKEKGKKVQSSKQKKEEPDNKDIGPVAGTIGQAEECTICLESLLASSSGQQQQQQQRSLDCGHTFHDKCIKSWCKEKHDCPCCRAHVKLQEDFPSLK